MTAEPCDWRHGYLREQRYVGTYTDRENDRLDWDVTVERCDRCGQVWILERTEDPAFSRSGRWRRARITDRLEERLNEQNFEEICTTKIRWHLSCWSGSGDGPEEIIGIEHDWKEPNDGDECVHHHEPPTNDDLPTVVVADENKVTRLTTDLPFWRRLIRCFRARVFRHLG